MNAIFEIDRHNPLRGCEILLPRNPTQPRRASLFRRGNIGLTYRTPLGFVAYAVFSVSTSNLDRVQRYIERQEEHHRKIGFQDELRVLLSKHAVQWDERHLWD